MSEPARLDNTTGAERQAARIAAMVAANAHLEGAGWVSRQRMRAAERVNADRQRRLDARAAKMGAITALKRRVAARKAREKAAGIKPSEQRLSLTNHRNGPAGASKRGTPNRRLFFQRREGDLEFNFHVTKGQRVRVVGQ